LHMLPLNRVCFALPGGPEMLWILLALVLLFGGRKLPELARAMGSSITQFKKGLKEPEDGDPDKIESKQDDPEKLT
ncbi:MAG: sec-independent protein translocase protein TatA, partial [Planctomycetota bacterium]